MTHNSYQYIHPHSFYLYLFFLFFFLFFEKTICLALGREMMLKILGDGIQVIILRNTQRWAIQKSEIFCNLTKIQVEKVLDHIKLQNYKTKDLLVKGGSVGSPKLFIVMDGTIKGGKGEKIEKGGIFGDYYFLEENRQKM